MQVSVEKLDGLTRRMTFSVSEEQIFQAVQDRLACLAGRAELKGFRPGKAPRHVVDQQLGQQVRQEVIGQVLMKGFYEAARRENLSPAGPPDIEPARLIETFTTVGSPQFIATFEVYPDVDLAPFESIEIERPQVRISEADVDRMLASLQLLKTEWHPVDRPARQGDRVIFDLKGKLGSERLRDATRVPWILGAPARANEFDLLVQGEFEGRLSGRMAGECFEVSIEFPKSHGNPSIAGKIGHFTIEIASVDEPHRPELDDGFARQFGVEAGGLAALRQATRENMERDRFAAIHHLTKQRTFDALLERNPVELPTARLRKEAERLCELATSKLLAQGVKERDIPLRAEDFETQAKRQLALGVILAKIVRDHRLKAPRETVDGVLDSLAANYENPEELKGYYREHPELMEELESTVLEDVVVEWLLPKIRIDEVPSSFEQLIKTADSL